MPASRSPKPKSALAPLDDLAEQQTRVPAAQSASAAAKRRRSRGEMATKAPTQLTPKKRLRDWRPAFLEAFAKLGMVSGACDAARITRQTAYAERARNPEFAQAWDEVEQRGVDQIELAARANAIGGNPTMQIFLLKTRRPRPSPPSPRKHGSPTSSRAAPTCSGRQHDRDRGLADA
jgi:hypothetical protein